MEFNQIKQFLLELNPQNIILFSVVSVLLCCFWLFLCLRLDRESPEPKKQIFRMFIWGGFMVFPALFISGPLTVIINQKLLWLNDLLRIFILSFLIDALIEEYAKYSILAEKVYPAKFFDEPKDGMIYGMIIGIGFSFVENFLYILTYISLQSGLTFVILRGAVTTLMHFLAGGIIGYYLGLAKFMPQKKNKLIWQGFIFVLLFHGLYNTIIRFGYDWTYIPLAILLIAVYTVVIYGLNHINKVAHFNPPPDQKA